MAETVYLNDGSMEVILTDKATFLERLIRERLGDDVARCFTEYLTELQEEQKYTEESAKEHEQSADGYLQMCRDACDSFREVLDLLDQPRLNRNALRTAAQNGYDDLNKNL